MNIFIYKIIIYKIYIYFIYYERSNNIILWFNKNIR